MEEQKEQKELFEFDKPRKQFPGLGGIFRKADFENRITVCLEMEKMVFLSIGILMLMVIVYALGVERGKASTVTARTDLKIAPVVQPAVAKKTAAIKPPVQQLKPVSDMPYTIAVGSYKSRDSAVAEASKYKSLGLEVFLKQSDQYFVVCVGAYPDKTSQQSLQALARVRQIRPDAYFRAR